MAPAQITIRVVHLPAKVVGVSGRGGPDTAALPAGVGRGRKSLTTRSRF
jgi:hypothetical protein